MEISDYVVEDVDNIVLGAENVIPVVKNVMEISDYVVEDVNKVCTYC